MSEQETGGRVKHPADCPCRVCKGVRTADARRQAEAEERSAIAAVARTLVQLMARGALSGPDALRNLVGHDDALRILRIAGMNPAQAAASWEAAAPVQQAQSAGRTAALWASSPDHDPRVVHALVHGASDAEIAAVRAQVAQEYLAAVAEKAARRQASGVMWHTRDGEAVTDGTAPPVQAASRVNQSVPPLGSEV